MSFLRPFLLSPSGSYKRDDSGEILLKMPSPCREGPPLSFLGFALILFVLHSFQVVATPRAFVADRRHSFGRVVEGETVSFDFKVENRGDLPLRVGRVLPGCGCAKVRYASDDIPPGGSTLVRVLFSSRGFSGDVETAIRVVVNDPQEPHIDVVLRGEVVSRFQSFPERVLFPDIPQSRGSDLQEITVNAPSVEGLEAVSSSRDLEVIIIARKQGQLRLGVRVMMGARPGELRERVIVRKSAEKGVSFSIPVFALVKPDLEASRSTIIFHNPSGVFLGPQSVLVNYHGDRPFGSLGIRLPHGGGGIRVTSKEIDPGRTWELVFYLDEKNLSGSLDERVIILGGEGRPSLPLRLLATSSR